MGQLVRVADGSNDREGICLEGFRTGSSDAYAVTGRLFHTGIV